MSSNGGATFAAELLTVVNLAIDSGQALDIKISTKGFFSDCEKGGGFGALPSPARSIKAAKEFGFVCFDEDEVTEGVWDGGALMFADSFSMV